MGIRQSPNSFWPPHPHPSVKRALWGTNTNTNPILSDGRHDIRNKNMRSTFFQQWVCIRYTILSKKLPSLACFLTLIELKSALTILASVLTTLKQEIAHLDEDEKVPQTHWASAPPPHTGNACFNRPRLKKGLPYVQSSKSALWFPFACFVNCCFFAIFVRCLALNPLLPRAPPRLWQPPPQGCDARTQVGGKPGLTWMQWDGVGKRYKRQNFNLVCKIITDW